MSEEPQCLKSEPCRPAFASPTTQALLEPHHALFSGQTHAMPIGRGRQSRRLQWYINDAVELSLQDIDKNSHYSAGHVHVHAQIIYISCCVWPRQKF